MKKYLFLIAVVFILNSSLYSQIEFNTFYTTTVGPGMVYKKIVAPQMPWELDVLEIDLTNPYLEIETVKANNRLKGREVTSSMAERQSYENHIVVGAINADFFDGDGVPSNSQVIQGEILKTEWLAENDPKYWSTIGFDINNRPGITRNRFVSHIRVHGNVHKIHDVNAARNTDYLVLYNSFVGSSTATNEWGTEALVSPITDWLVNDTVRCVVEKVEQRIGNMVIPTGKSVLSGHGTSETFITEHINIGDTVAVYMGLEPALPELKELVGGFPRIVKNGQNYAIQGYAEEGGAADFHTARHPRTAVGFNADSTTFYFVTVDGRQQHSIGMSLMELADFMISIGVAQGLNLDGGGSTTMVVRGDIKNSPSDGTERAVANALLAISSAPQGELTQIQIEPDHCTLIKDNQLAFSTSGWDQYYNPASLSEDQIMYEIDPSLGTVTQDGVLTATVNGGEGWLYTNYNGLQDSAYIYINPIKKITLTPHSITTDTTRTIQFRVEAEDEDGIVQNLPLSRYEWQSTHPEIGNIDENGLFRGIAAGATEVIARYAELADTSQVLVDIVTNTVLLDSMDSLQNWSISGENIDTVATSISVVDTPRTFGNKAFMIDYQFTRLSTDPSWIFLKTDIPVNGVPDTIQVDVKSDGSRHKLYVVAEDNNGELFQAPMLGYATGSSYRKVNVRTIYFQPVDKGEFFYPIRIKGIHIKLGTNTDIGEINKGTLYLDNFRLQYPKFSSIHETGHGMNPKYCVLHQNYPNPFNPDTVIRYEIPKSTKVNLTVYNSLGQKIEALVDGFQNAGHHSVVFRSRSLASGTYIYRLQAGDVEISRNMTFVK